MKFKREIVTPFLGFVFVVVALTGILMFFHLLDGYTSVVHEFLGLAFVLFAIMHVISNWKSIKNYSAKRMFLIQSIVVLALSTAIIVIGKVNGNVEQIVIEKLLKAPSYTSFRALNINYTQAETILRKNNIAIRDSLQSIEEISFNNQKSPEEVMELIIE